VSPTRDGYDKPGMQPLATLRSTLPGRRRNDQGLWRRRLDDLRETGRTAPAWAWAVPAGAAGFAFAYFLDPSQGKRRRKVTLQRAGGLWRRTRRRGGQRARYAASETVGLARRAAHPRAAQAPPPDDVTLARKVETEIFRPADSPKGSVNVDAVNGVVSLRGQVPSAEVIAELERKARRIPGVRDVENLLHLPGTPAPAHSGGAGTDR
jgi:BON domain